MGLAGCVLAAVLFGPAASAAGQVVIPDTERHEVPSAIVDETFKLHVYLPRGYESGTDRLPVVYLLDAEYAFGAVAYIVRRLVKDALIPPVLLGARAIGTAGTSCGISAAWRSCWRTGGTAGSSTAYGSSRRRPTARSFPSP
jgi:hypothetical protein